MEITYKQLTDKGVKIGFSTDNLYTIQKVLVDNADNYCNLSCVASSKHSFVCDFELEENILTVFVPSDASTLIFITIYGEYTNEDGSVVEDKATTMFVNEFSIFKAKTTYLDVICGCNSCNCCNSCHDSYHHGRCKNDCCAIGSNSVVGLNNGSCSNWTYTCCNSDCCEKSGTYCRGCEDKNKTYSLMCFLLRWNLFSQCYKKNNVKGALKYYKDLCRVKDLNKIPFDYVDIDFNYSTNPGKLHDLFNTMNTWIKNNVDAPCWLIIEKLLIVDMYSLIFDKANNDGSPEWIFDDHIWNMENEYWINNKTWS